MKKVALILAVIFFAAIGLAISGIFGAIAMIAITLTVRFVFGPAIIHCFKATIRIIRTGIATLAAKWFAWYSARRIIASVNAATPATPAAAPATP